MKAEEWLKANGVNGNTSHMEQYARKFAAEQLRELVAKCRRYHVSSECTFAMETRAAELEKDGGQG